MGSGFSLCSRAVRGASLCLLVLTLACGDRGKPDTRQATKLDGKVELEAKPKPIILGPEQGEAAAAPPLSPPPDPDAPTGITDESGKPAKVVWDSDYRVQALAVDETHVYVSRVALPGGDRGEIARAPIAGGGLEVVVGDLGRPDELAVDGDEVFWIDRPGSEGDPAPGIRAVAKGGGEPRTVVTDPRVEYGLTVDGDRVFWVLRVEDQGKTGGFASAPRAGGEPQDHFRERGPVFHLAAEGGRLFFMAHVGNQPDVVYTAKADGSDLRELHVAARGIVAIRPAGDQVYFAQANFEQLRTSVMRVPLAGGEAKTLWRLDGKLLDQLAVDGERVWTSTSAVEDVGEVFTIPLAGGDATKVAQSRHVWKLFGVGARVLWWDTHYVDQTKMHRVRTLGG